MNKFIFLATTGILIILLAGVGFLYKTESDKNQLLRTEHLKTADDALVENKRLKEELKIEKEKALEEKKRLLDQIDESSRKKDRADKAVEAVKKAFLKEREMSLAADDDLDSMRKEVAALRKDGRDNIGELEKSFNKKKQLYETRILSLEAQLTKSKGKVSVESERYHYNLGVLYSQNKDYESAVREFKAALSYNPKNAPCHYNLGIIFDDYFKDKENARFHYRAFLELSPTSDDAESVKEWLAGLDK
jgi:tetratricopeptide (TPR) repeat protein